MQSRLGWHIVFVIAAAPADMDFMPLNDTLRARITQLVKIKKMEERYDHILAEQKNELDVQVKNSLVPEIARDWERNMEQNLPTFQAPPEQ